MMMLLRYFSNLFCLIAFLGIVSCDTDGNIASSDSNFFMKLYGDDGDQAGVDFLVLNDGTFLLLGNSQLGFTKKIYLVKADTEGKVIWQRKFGSSSEVAKDIEPTADGNFVILSTFIDPANDSTDVKLIRIRPDGTTLDSATYGSPKNDNAQTITPLADGGFIVTGSTQWDTAKLSAINPDAYSNIFHYRCNAALAFDANWYMFYGATNKFDAGIKVMQEASDRFYVFGYSTQDHPGNLAGKMNLQYYSIGAGGIISNNVGYLGEFDQNTRAAFVCRVPQQLGAGFFIIGTKTSNTGAVTLHVSKLRSPLYFNPADDEQLDQEIVFNDRSLEAVSATPSLSSPNGYILLANENRTLGTNLWIAKIDQGARQQWSISLGSEEKNDTGAAIQELPDGRIMVLGTVGIGDNQTKMALFKLNSAGRLQD